MDPPSLRELAVQQCMRFASQLQDIGGVRYGLLEPVLSRLNSRQLRAVEQQTPEICASSDNLWKNLILKEFSESPLPTHNFRDAYFRLQAEKDQHLGAARERLKKNQTQAARARAHSQISITEPVRLPHSNVWRSSTMQQLAKQTSLASRQRSMQRPTVGPPPPLWSPAHSPPSGSPPPPKATSSAISQRSPPPPKRPLPAPSESDRKRKAAGIFIRR